QDHRIGHARRPHGLRPVAKGRLDKLNTAHALPPRLLAPASLFEPCLPHAGEPVPQRSAGQFITYIS
ncbi:hypothetical protein, partial [Pseudorhodoplanes sp.]|uniref:hypothetical protein n=1 Tax=Pseudorhodoplanes sp. TaxID=1934341 RepID=UPI003D13F090